MKNKKGIVYLDMDGVLANFIGTLHKRGMKFPYTDINLLLSYMDNNKETLFTELEKMPCADLFFDFYRKNKDRVRFLSALPRHWNKENQMQAHLDKSNWLKKHIGPEFDESHLITVTDKKYKQIYAVNADVVNFLVDDHDTTIMQFIYKGGQGWCLDTNDLSYTEDFINDMAKKCILTLESFIQNF